MNKLQKMIMSFAAVALIVGFSAFKSASNKTITDWYEPNTTIAYPSSAALDHSNYSSTPLSVIPTESDCPGDGNVCAARFPNTAEEPVAVLEKQ